ncbi:MAG: cytochrome [Solirubrobacterales bacterium]|jgi:mono/diheme cytochrome c family protein|nr:cytochrome [Solirubrobacterales bacterium]
MHETFFFICGGILAASAIVVSLFGLKNDNFPGKWMPLIVVWFAVFAVGAGTFAVLHGKDESKDHAKEYAKASEEIQKADTSGPFVEAEEEAREAETGESAEGAEGEGLVEGEQAQEEKQSEPGGEGEAGEGEAPGGGGNAELGAAVFGENCSTCHGATGLGGNGGPDLTTMPLAQSEEGAIQQVTNGGGGMPAFEGVLSEEEIENVAAYVVQEITHGE